MSETPTVLEISVEGAGDEDGTDGSDGRACGWRRGGSAEDAAAVPDAGAEEFLFLFYAPSETSCDAGRASLRRIAMRQPPSPRVGVEASTNARAALEHWLRGADGILQSF